MTFMTIPLQLLLPCSSITTGDMVVFCYLSAFNQYQNVNDIVRSSERWEEFHEPV